MNVKELIKALSKLPLDDKLIIAYTHEDNPNETYLCDVHDLLVGKKSLQGTSFMEIIGRGKAEQDRS